MLFCAGALASAVNAVAGGGSLISFPSLVAFGIPALPANATNSVALWPGSLSGAIGFINLLPKTGKYFGLLFAPTLLGAIGGALLLVLSPQRLFDLLVPILIVIASTLLLLQPQVKRLVLGERHELSPVWGVGLQFLVAVYGGYFGAGMGIMMLAAFALYMRGSIHELNAVKNWLGLIINFVASLVFVFSNGPRPPAGELVVGLVWVWPGLALGLGSIVGGFAAARLSQRVQPDKLRIAIAIYGFLMAGYFVWRAVR